MNISIYGNEGRFIPTDYAIFASEIESGMKYIGKIIVPDDNWTTRGIRPRWVKIFAVGSKVTDLKKDDWVLVEHGKWSYGIEVVYNGEVKTIRMIDPKGLLVVSTEDVGIS